MKWYTLEVDETIWNYLQKHAEPLTDTANSVLHKLLFGTSAHARLDTSSRPRKNSLGKQPILTGIPKALEQILDVVKEVVKIGRSRPDATKVVAKRHGDRKPQTILDKYCRQLGMKAYDFDKLLMEPGLHTLTRVLKERFPRHQDQIDSFLDSLQSQPSRPVDVGTKHQSETEIGRRRIYIRTPNAQTTGKVYGTRKKRDPELEKMLKESLGNKLKENWGSFSLRNRSLLDFGNKRILCKYSSFSEGQRKWFWGVSKIYWNEWQDTDYLALILEDGIGGYSYLLFKSEEARRLFKNSSESNGEKKISMRIYADDDKPHLQDWQSFDVEGRMRKLNIDWL